MSEPLKILFVSSEVAPFAKTGGLAEVAGSLPKSIKELGHDVRVFLPYYSGIRKSGTRAKEIFGKLRVPITDRVERCSISQVISEDSVPVYLLTKERYFGRPYLYGTPGNDYEDNAERFTFFCRAAMEMLKNIDFCPDVIHCNDWQTGLIPLFLNSLYKEDSFFAKTATLFTIHNLAYQGIFWDCDMHFTGLPWSYFTPAGIEFYGKMNLMKAGIVFADQINTVSETYAKEIQTFEFGCGLEGILSNRSKDLSGILNGIDYDVFNPETDKSIAKTYSYSNISGKTQCKEELQKICDLPVNDRIPIIGIVARLIEQKGFNLLVDVMDKIMDANVQLVVLGTGLEKYETFFREIAKKYPKKTAVFIRYDTELSKKIYAGSDMFFMPSKYEPCGLGQMISLRYGTVPVVRRTGGLADVISTFDSETSNGNGYSFDNYTSSAMLSALKKSLEAYEDKSFWTKLVKKNMEEDVSWKNSAVKYVKLYNKSIHSRISIQS